LAGSLARLPGLGDTVVAMKVRLLRLLTLALLVTTFLVGFSSASPMFLLGFALACAIWEVSDLRHTAEIRALVKEFDSRRTSSPRVLRP
jgi:hypothetical protein